MPLRYAGLCLVLLSSAFTLGCGSSKPTEPTSPELPSGTWALSAYRLGDGPLIDAGPTSREAQLIIEPVGSFSLVQTTQGGVTTRQGVVVLDGEDRMTLLVDKQDGTGVEEVLSFLWATDGVRLTLTESADAEWLVSVYERTG